MVFVYLLGVVASNLQGSEFGIVYKGVECWLSGIKKHFFVHVYFQLQGTTIKQVCSMFSCYISKFFISVSKQLMHVNVVSITQLEIVFINYVLRQFIFIAYYRLVLYFML